MRLDQTFRVIDS